MSKFEFVLNNDLQNEFKSPNKKIEPLKFDILAGNEIKLKGNLYEEIVKILQSSFKDFPITQFTPFRDTSSFCRRFLNFVTVPGRFTSYNYDVPAMCLNNVEINNSNIICEYDIVTLRSMIQSINFASQILVSYNTLRTLDQNSLMERMLRELYLFEDKLFCNILQAQSPLYYNISMNEQAESVLYDMINRFESENLQFESFLTHPRLVNRLFHTSTFNSNSGLNTLFGIPLHSSTLIENDAIYLLSTNLGQMYMFENIEFSNNELFDMASRRFYIREHLNLTMTNNFVKTRIN